MGAWTISRILFGITFWGRFERANGMNNYETLDIDAVIEQLHRDVAHVIKHRSTWLEVRFSRNQKLFLRLSAGG